MSRKPQKYVRKPAGSISGGEYKIARSQIGIDEETRKIIAEWAKYNNRAFAAEVRILILEGLNRRTR